MIRLPTWILFLSLLSGLLFLANLVVYQALVVIFGIDSNSLQIILAFALAAASSSFLISSIIGKDFYNAFTRIYYAVSAIWIGFFCFLFQAAFVYCVLVTLLGTSLPGLGMSLVAACAAATIYGLFHARKIYVKEVHVPIPNLPVIWRQRKAVWISDLHLGQLHGSEFAETVVQKVNALSPDIVFIGGDLYDGTGAPDVGELIFPLRKLQAPQGIFFVTGNHEEFTDSTKFIIAIESAGITVLQEKLIDFDGVQLIGVGFENTDSREKFRTVLSRLPIDPRKPSILLKHEPRFLEEAAAAGISLQISGHTHRGQQWPFEYLARMVYKKFFYGLRKLGSMHVYTSSGTGTWGPPLRVGTNSEIVIFTFS